MMYYVSESLKYFWYLLGYVNENVEEYATADFVVIEKETNNCESWKNFIENMKKEKESNDFPLHYENKWKIFLTENNKKKMS